MRPGLLRGDLTRFYQMLASGKARNLYLLDEDTVLFVAADRISAHDAIMNNGIPHKGLLLTQLSAHWFQVLQTALPDLGTHFLTTDLPSRFSRGSYEWQMLESRTMQVRRAKVFPLEAIVRGYLTGSAWVEYQKSGTVHGRPMAPGLQESQAFPEGPIFTPSTKAGQGAHDENISIERAIEIVGEDYAKQIEEKSLQVYRVAHDYAERRGIIIADTKFEFGLDWKTNELLLVDEVLTPDSSRFWSRDAYQLGKPQKSYDKQLLRDWLSDRGLKGREWVSMPSEIVEKTAMQYRQIYEILTGRTFDDLVPEEREEREKNERLSRTAMVNLNAHGT